MVAPLTRKAALLGQARFDPLSSFRSGEKGVLLTASRTGDLFSDSGVTPATVGGVVGQWNDWSGNGVLMRQTTAGSRPLWDLTNGKYSVRFDDVDDFISSTATLNFSATDEVSIVMAFSKRSDATVGIGVSFGNANADAGACDVTMPNAAASSSIAFRSRGATTTSTAASAATAAPYSGVLEGYRKIGANTASLVLDGVPINESLTAQGGGNNGNLTLAVGARTGGVNPSALWLYHLMIINRLLTPAECIGHRAYARASIGS